MPVRNWTSLAPFGTRSFFSRSVFGALLADKNLSHTFLPVPLDPLQFLDDPSHGPPPSLDPLSQCPTALRGFLLKKICGAGFCFREVYHWVK